MFQKILIANRGEIACRVAATARRMGVRTVAVYSDADAQAKHVAACDEAVHIGGSAPQESYLQWQRIIDAARSTGAQAIHPGYGFLSENADFARACAAAGLVFIGPPPEAIEAMGLKAESKRLMEAAGVPLVPGYHGANQDAALLQAEADAIGYPVIIKASAGGGGKGMRVVESAEDFAAALASCQREARSSFGSDAVLIERYVQRPRHIEIQVFGDTHGHYVYLFERDCSVQRRHQKLLEEAPAPGMTAELRQQMGLAAVAAARAVGYVGAGTVEFIVEQPGGYGLDDGRVEAGMSAAAPSQRAKTSSGGSEPRAAGSAGARFFFMEMNTRLQVEHPVTEAITGLDLVEWQLRVAAGEPLPRRQEELRIHGHAIEARLCAENPERQFLPATGRLEVYRCPESVAFQPPVGAAVLGVQPVRIDSGVREGDVVSPYYDSMLAKLIVHGATRDEALARLDAALAATHIVGVAANLQFLRLVAASASFRRAELDTALIAREAEHVFGQERVGPTRAVAAAVAHTLRREAALEDHDPFSRRDGWRAWGEWQRSIRFAFGEATLDATLRYHHDGSHSLALGELRDRLEVAPADGDALDIRYAGERRRYWVYGRDETLHVFCDLGATQVVEIDALAHAGEGPSEGGRLSAPMPGKVVSFAVQPGDTVRQGQTLAVMEAMKMEHTLTAPADGVVVGLLYAPGDQVAEGAELLRLQTPS